MAIEAIDANLDPLIFNMLGFGNFPEEVRICLRRSPNDKMIYASILKGFEIAHFGNAAAHFQIRDTGIAERADQAFVVGLIALRSVYVHQKNPSHFLLTQELDQFIGIVIEILQVLIIAGPKGR